VIQKGNIDLRKLRDYARQLVAPAGGVSPEGSLPGV
jgi:hypothetical protein